MADMDPIASLNSRYHYCASPSLGLVECAAAFLSAGQLPHWEQIAGQYQLMTHRCRTAIRAVLPALGIAHGAEVLAPAYSCGSEIDAILATGASIRLFDITPDLRITIESVEARITSSTKAVYVIHYFGWPQDINPIRQLCNERGLLLLEDCALSLFSKDSAGWLGRSGDVSFFSILKSFGVPNGAVTVSRRPLEISFPKSPKMSVFSECMRLIKRDLIRKMSRTSVGIPFGISKLKSYSSSKVTTNGREVMPSSYFYDDSEMSGSCMSRITLGVINTVNPNYVVQTRRTNYLRIANGIKEIHGASPLFDTLPDGVCPLVFPLVVNDRKFWVNYLSRLGAWPTAWWSGYHPNFDFTDFPNSCHLKGSILALPIHQQLSKADIDFLISCVWKVSKMHHYV